MLEEPTSRKRSRIRSWIPPDGEVKCVYSSNPSANGPSAQRRSAPASKERSHERGNKFRFFFPALARYFFESPLINAAGVRRPVRRPGERQLFIPRSRPWAGRVGATGPLGPPAERGPMAEQRPLAGANSLDRTESNRRRCQILSNSQDVGERPGFRERDASDSMPRCRRYESTARIADSMNSSMSRGAMLRSRGGAAMCVMAFALSVETRFTFGKDRVDGDVVRFAARAFKSTRSSFISAEAER